MEPFQSLYCMCACLLSRFSRVWLFAALWIVARQAPLSMEFSRQEYCSGLPCPPPGDLSDPGVKPASLMSPALACGFFTTSTTWEARCIVYRGTNRPAPRPPNSTWQSREEERGVFPKFATMQWWETQRLLAQWQGPRCNRMETMEILAEPVSLY